MKDELGDPFDWHARALALDEAEEFPAEPVAELQRQGYMQWLVPRAHGGKLESLVDAAELQRAVSRRDLTVAIALGQCFLGSVAVWLAGSAEQRERVARLLLRGGLMGLALTEEEHGSDVLASEVVAEGSLLRGRKWLINNGTRGDAWTVFARSSAEGGLSGFSLFVVEKGERVRPLEKKRTHGIRGADISGFVLDGAPGSLIEPLGSGMELALKSLQITRTGCAQFSLGAADTCLRVALDFALERKLYGSPALDIPHVRATLTNAFLDLLICDVLALAATRALHAAPGQMSLWSAVVKYFVPTTVDRVLRELAVILGARHYLREGRAAIFQKMLRDAAVVGLFDGSTAVNLDSIGVQLPRLVPARAAQPDERAGTLRKIFSLSEPLPPLDPAGFELMNAGRDNLTQGVSGHAVLEAALEELRGRSAPKRSPELFALAQRHCALTAAACLLHLWRHSRPQLDEFLAGELGLQLCLDRLLAPQPGFAQEATDAMLRLRQAHQRLLR